MAALSSDQQTTRVRKIVTTDLRQRYTCTTGCQQRSPRCAPSRIMGPERRSHVSASRLPFPYTLRPWSCSERGRSARAETGGLDLGQRAVSADVEGFRRNVGADGLEGRQMSAWSLLYAIMSSRQRTSQLSSEAMKAGRFTFLSPCTGEQRSQ